MFRSLVDTLNASLFGAWFLKLFTTRRALWLAMPLAALITGGVVKSASTPAANATIALSSDPLYSRGVRAKPALALALSVEFPTTGQTYQGSYVPATEYIGYFDATSCYTYNDTKKQYDFLSRTSATTSNGVTTYGHTCGGTGFSGNFMNWATSSAIDILRYGMTGGDRIVDTTSETVLQRAVLQSSFYNSSNFVAKSIDAATAATVLPSSMLSTRTVSTVWIANCLNRVHFGTSSTGNCSAPGDNTNLGTATSTGSLNTNVTFASSKPSDVSTYCAGENGTCSFAGNTREVWYGAGSNWYFKVFTNSTACSNGVFGDPISGTVKACYVRPNANTTTTSTTNSTYLTVDSFFTVRVGVCNISGGVLLDPRTSLCTLYPNGTYKPTGNLQQYSDSVRVAAMGYLYDSSPARYGGVLRAPMKYVGPRTYDANFNLVSGSNPKREWDETTGIFIQNPEGSDNPQGTGSTAISGVINYLNQFGRTGTTPGSYKTYDPVGELYYETLRYLQGLSPTPQAISGLTDTFADGYPVYTTWADPLPQIAGLGNTGDYSCVRTNILTIGDIHTHFDRSLPGYLGLAGSSTNDFARLPNIANNEQDFLLWTTKVGVLEGIPALGTMTSQDNGNYFMVGAAYWAHTNDFRPANWTTQPDRQRPGMRVKTYMIDVDEYGQSSASFGTRSTSQLYLAAKYGGFTDSSGTGNPFVNALGLPDLLSNWQQANGDASTYFLAGNPQAMLASISQIFQQIAQSANSIAGGATNTSNLATASGDFYQAQFDPTYWSGDLLDRGLTVTASTGTISTATPTVRWDAATLLAGRASTSRNIVVGRYKDDVTTLAAATPFVWANLDTRYQTALRTPSYSASAATPDSAASGAERVNYLRGDRTLESPSGPYRKRASLIGDIVNSGVTYKAEPTTGLPDTSYSTFYNSQFNSSGNLIRNKAVYVGANDGMLHAFDASTGSELFAYIPSFVVPYLVNLTNPSYVHRSYVDATPVVDEAQLNTTDTTSWKTVLVGGAGAGGQGVFALDVTSPGSFSSTNVLWEFTELNDPDLGNVVGKPHIVKVRTSASTATTPVYKWYAAVTSGVNSNANDGNFNSDGRPALFFLELGKARSAAWQLGVNYFKVKFTQASGTLAYGMAGFNTVLGPAGELAQVYAGDLQGNLWKLNFSTVTQANAFNVNVNSLLSTSTGSAVATTPLFVAKNGTTSAAAVQPITGEPSIAYGYNQTTLVTFGTGKFLEASDIAGPYTGQVQSIYTLVDDNTTMITGRSMLTSQTASATGLSVTGTTPILGGAGNSYGWYFDLPYSGSGERQVSSMQVLYGYVYFSTVIPALGGCDPGSGNDYVLNLLSGNGTFVRSTVGLLGPQAAIELKSTATPAPPDSTGRRVKKGLIQTLSQGTNGILANTATPTDIVTGRLSWRQIMNYQDLHNATP